VSGLADSGPQLGSVVRVLLRRTIDTYRDSPQAAGWLQYNLRRFDEPLRVAIAGKVKAGKSTLLNALVGAELMATNALATFGKGRHTTVTRELHASASGGAVIDTPGLRGVGLLDTGGLAAVFPEVEELAAHCRFGDCAHTGEPGCAVLAAVEAGDVPEDRLERWRKLQREAQWVASRTDARLRKAREQEWKVINKSVRANRIRP
jgi:ribosome biogenesis GTPase